MPTMAGSSQSRAGFFLAYVIFSCACISVSCETYQHARFQGARPIDVLHRCIPHFDDVVDELRSLTHPQWTTRTSNLARFWDRRNTFDAPLRPSVDFENTIQALFAHPTFGGEHACTLVRTILCTELGGGHHIACDSHIENRAFLGLMQKHGWIISELGAGFLGHTVGLYDFPALSDTVLDCSRTLCLGADMYHQHYASAVRSIRKHAFYRMPFVLDQAALQGIFRGLSKSRFVDRTNPETNFVQGLQPPTPEEAPWASGSALWLYDQNDCLEVPEIQRVAFDPFVLSVVQSYLGAPPILSKCDVWMKIQANQGNDKHNATFDSWHADFNGLRTMKVFIFLSDVTPKTGPHTFVRGSHTSFNGLRNDYFAEEVADQDIAHSHIWKMHPGNELMQISGQAGTIIIEDTHMLHKATPVLEGYRLMMQLDYSVSGLGGKDHSERLYRPLSKVPKSLLPLESHLPRVFRRMRLGRFDSPYASNPAYAAPSPKLERLLGTICRGDTSFEALLNGTRIQRLRAQREHDAAYMSDSSRVPTKSVAFGTDSGVVHLSRGRPRAWALWLSQQDEVYPALVLCKALVERLATDHSVVVFTPEGHETMIDELHLTTFEALGAHVRTVPRHTSSALSEDETLSGGLMRLVAAFRATEFDRIGLLELSQVPLRSIDWLLDMELSKNQFGAPRAPLDACETSQNQASQTFATSPLVIQPDMNMAAHIDNMAAMLPSQSPAEATVKRVLSSMVSHGHVPAPRILHDHFLAADSDCRCDLTAFPFRDRLAITVDVASMSWQPWHADSWSARRRELTGIDMCSSPEPPKASMNAPLRDCLSEVYCQWVRDHLLTMELLSHTAAAETMDNQTSHGESTAASTERDASTAHTQGSLSPSNRICQLHQLVDRLGRVVPPSPSSSTRAPTCRVDTAEHDARILDTLPTS